MKTIETNKFIAVGDFYRLGTLEQIMQLLISLGINNEEDVFVTLHHGEGALLDGYSVHPNSGSASISKIAEISVENETDAIVVVHFTKTMEIENQIIKQVQQTMEENYVRMIDYWTIIDGNTFSCEDYA